MKGRRLGSTELTIEEMDKIVKLTNDGCSRGEISNQVGRCKKTIYLWQKKLIS